MLLLCAACGRARDDAPEVNGSAGGWTDEPDGAPGTHWLALLNENVELIRFDDDSPPRHVIVAPLLPGDVSAAFSDDGKELSYAQQGELHVVSAPDGSASSRSWLVDPYSPKLTWLGNSAIVAVPSYPRGAQLIHTDQDAVQDLGAASSLQVSANQSALVLSDADERFVYLDSTSAPARTDPMPVGSVARLSDDGRAVAIFSQREIPASTFPVPTRRIQWTPPTLPACTSQAIPPFTPCPAPPKYSVGSVAWPSADAPMIAEFQSQSDPVLDQLAMTLVTIDPGDGALDVTNVYFRIAYRNWGVDRDGHSFLVANGDDTTMPWWVAVRSASNWQYVHFSGVNGFALYAALSGDQRALLVASFVKSTGTSTLYSVPYPPVDGATPSALFTSDQSIGALLPRPGGAQFLLGAGDVTFAQSCPDPTTSDCDSLVYWLSDGQSPAQPLPAGLENPQWTPDGAGIVANLADGRVVYLNAAAPGQPKTLGHGRFVLPNHW